MEGQAPLTPSPYRYITDLPTNPASLCCLGISALECNSEGKITQAKDTYIQLAMVTIRGPYQSLLAL